MVNKILISYQHIMQLYWLKELVQNAKKVLHLVMIICHKVSGLKM
jgi:hypothetical protein